MTEKPKRKAKWQNDYISRSYDRVNLTMPKGRKDEVKAHADTRGESLNAFINRAIDSQIQRDNEGNQ